VRWRSKRPGAARSRLGGPPAAALARTPPCAGIIQPFTRLADLDYATIERDAYRVLIGRDAKVMDKLYRLNPRRAARLVAGKMRSLLTHAGP
jgi:hypothetical protein